ncbi:stringent starvation protein B [secondary endosymbiont of Heteropsylla cubana]|uniref:Stringent starvation protein B n=1 Tax=secondary endosymbiont of Heteropsylla cubana TaxID=134287 RepID=J3TZ98_9ENTR|nr:ClpXP protease specificity-enhancing factor [secondary endosymbiont of Heteropsylla cubana]AFP85830.1 stringent starvation protein B [secondary endosymbiont of Heteropsylla cubana]
MNITQCLPQRPYLLRAFYEWLTDNQLTPHLVVNVTFPEVVVPVGFAHDGKIILNIAPCAISNLNLGNKEIHFNARFNRVLHPISIPTAAILAIYARENGIGTMFDSKLAYNQITNANLNMKATSDTSKRLSLFECNKLDNVQSTNLKDKLHQSALTTKHPTLRVVK